MTQHGRITNLDLGQALFAPRAVALVGASGDADKNTARPMRFLRQHGYGGRIIPINPTRREVLGEPAWSRLADAPGDIDQAFVMAPGEAVEQALEDCGRRGVPVMSIFSDGFADRGADGEARQARLTARARELGVRVLGPNSMGMVNVPGRIALTVNAAFETHELHAGTTSIVSQSGTMLGTVMSRGAARGMGYAKLVSVGNEADLGVGELVELLAQDAETRVILLFLETVRDAVKLAAAARLAHKAGKPVVAYKLGRSVLGAALARSHTGALAGTDAALDAYFLDCGILRVGMLETLFEIVPLVEGRTPPASNEGASARRVPRVAVITTTGGGAGTVVDQLGLRGIQTYAPGSTSPIIDLTMAGGTAQKYTAALEQVMAAPECDGVIGVVGSSAQFHPQVAVKPILQAPRGAKPLAAFFTPQADRSLALLAKQGIAAFRTPEACADAFEAYFAWRAPTVRKHDALRTWPSSVPTRGRLDENQALDLFDSLGMRTVKREVARAPDFTHTLPYPVAAKILSAELAHKTEAGGVALGITDRDDFEAKTRAMRAAFPSAPILVQVMEHGIAEAILGYRDDPLVGPVVMVGAGGVLAEIYQDVALRLAPVTLAQALEMMTEVRGFALLRGYRGLPEGDTEALARAVVALSRLALLPGRPVAEADVNPVIVKPRGASPDEEQGAVAVDGLVVLKE